MNTLQQLCETLELPLEVSRRILLWEQECDFVKLADSMKLLFSKDTWDMGREKLKELLREDPDGIKMLTCMLKCGLTTLQHYRMLGIDDAIFIDTMKCFRRFVLEHKESYGTYAFDRDWWTPRQLSALLFRIGELEYELNEFDGKSCISLHIPSDSRLETSLLQESYQKARGLINQVFPSYACAPIRCSSWLLSPALSHVLPSGSRILRFQKAFVIDSFDKENPAFMTWVYKRPDLPLSQLPENTTLQRNLKAYLAQGGKIGEAAGYLSEPAFL